MRWRKNCDHSTLGQHCYP